MRAVATTVYNAFYDACYAGAVAACGIVAQVRGSVSARVFVRRSVIFLEVAQFYMSVPHDTAS